MIDKDIQETLKEQFRNLMNKVDRQGKTELMQYIEEKSDFYTAPASTRFHGNYEGGLMEHSLNVYQRLKEKVETGFFGEYEEETIIVAALLHDLCKTNFYTQELKNQKTYDKDKVAGANSYQVKHDNNGDFIWETVPAYAVDDKIPYGHGEKSVMMVDEFMRLKPVERYAIRWHMGFSEPKENWGTLGEAMKRYPLIVAIHEADLEATYILEKQEEK